MAVIVNSIRIFGSLLFAVGLWICNDTALAGQHELTGDLVEVRNWAYQLSDIDLQELIHSRFDLIVMDYSRDGSDENAFSPDDLTALKIKPDGSRRLVLSYLSIGEAEDYRYYWKPDWKIKRPAWLDKQNPHWPGNYKVHYWDSQWQQIIFGQKTSYLDRIIAAGFDGVYLDIVDAFEYYEDSRKSAARDMIDLVTAISKYGKKQSKPFYVLAQNGERLLDYPEYRSVIDGLGIEDLFYGYDNEGMPNAPEVIQERVRFLTLARRSGKIILTVDYIDDPLPLKDVYRKSKSLDFIPYASERDLDSLIIHPGLDP